jgi:hypothetical protein
MSEILRVYNFEIVRPVVGFKEPCFGHPFLAPDEPIVFYTDEEIKKIKYCHSPEGVSNYNTLVVNHINPFTNGSRTISTTGSLYRRLLKKFKIMKNQVAVKIDYDDIMAIPIIEYEKNLKKAKSEYIRLTLERENNIIKAKKNWEIAHALWKIKYVKRLPDYTAEIREYNIKAQIAQKEREMFEKLLYNNCKKWSDFIVYKGLKYGLPYYVKCEDSVCVPSYEMLKGRQYDRKLDNLQWFHKENDCNGMVVYYDGACTCHLCEDWYGCSDPYPGKKYYECRRCGIRPVQNVANSSLYPDKY